MPTLRRRADGLWFADYRLGRRRYRRSLRTANPAIAKERFKAIAAELELGIHRPASKTLLSKFVETFLDHQEGKRTEKTVATQRFQLERFVAHAGDIRLSEVMPAHVVAFLDEVTETPATWNRYRAALHRMFGHAVRLGELEANPVDRVDHQREERKPPRFLTAEERDRLLAAVAGKDMEVPVALGVFAGLRRGEIARLRWEDVDLDEGRLLVRKAKSKRFRALPLHRRLEALLKERRPPDETKGMPGLPVATRKGKTWNVDTLSHELRALGGPLGIAEKLRGPHVLRETFASLLVQAGEDVYRVRDWLGHSSVAVTERYAHLAPGRRGKIDEV